MRIYLAGPWTCREEVRQAACRFEAAGHTITEAWWSHRDVALQDPQRDIKLRQQAHHDVSGILTAQRFIFLNWASSEGKCVELGMALTLKTPILAVGMRSLHNIFHYLPQITWVLTVEKAIEHLTHQTATPVLNRPAGS